MCQVRPYASNGQVNTRERIALKEHREREKAALTGYRSRLYRFTVLPVATVSDSLTSSKSSPPAPQPMQPPTGQFFSRPLCSFAAILFADSPISITHLKLRLVTRFPLDTATDARPLVRVDRFVEQNCIDSHAEIPAR